MNIRSVCTLYSKVELRDNKILSIKIQDGGYKNGGQQCGQISLRANSTVKIP
jgi:hypothetical protein